MNPLLRASVFAVNIILMLSLIACSDETDSNQGSNNPSQPPTLESPANPVSDASICFPSYMQPGKTITTTTNTSILENGNTSTFTVTTQNAYSNGIFYGQNALQETSEDGSGTSQFYAIDTANKTVTNLGSTYCVVIGSATRSYLLTPGQSTELNYQWGCNGQVSDNIQTTYTFIGFEKISVPAGTFDSCKFEVLETQSGNTKSYTIHLRQGDGVQLMYESSISGANESYSTELVSMEIN